MPSSALTRLATALLAAPVVLSFSPGAPGGLAPTARLHRPGLCSSPSIRPPPPSLAGVSMMAAEPTGTRWTADDASAKKEAGGKGDDEAVKGKPQSLAKALKKPKGTICVVSAVKRKDPAQGKLCEMTEDGFILNEVGRGFHDAKVAGIAVWTDEERYGTSMEDLATIVESQKSFKGNFPGPCPVLALDLFMTKAAVSDAARAGASAVLLSAEMLGDELEGMLEHTAACGMDGVVLCNGEGDIEAASGAGAAIVALDSRALGIDAAMELRKGMDGKAITVAFGGLNDLLDAWRLRDAGFQCVVVGAELMSCAFGKAGEVRQGGGKEGMGASVLTGNNFRKNDVNAFVKAMCSKASTKYGPSSVDAFKERGAKFKRHYEV